jgi:Flp pilus assembly protein TadB
MTTEHWISLLQFAAMVAVPFLVWRVGADNQRRNREQRLQTDLLKSELRNELHQEIARTRHALRNEFQSYVSELVRDVAELKNRWRRE